MFNSSQKPVVLWLAVVCLMIFAMVVIGGITRLTHSGLSMVEWQPLMGAIPPLNEAQWQEVFAKYQDFPEFQKVNFQMSLEEFKFIFFWEYLHRLIGRLIGVAFVVPWIVFIYQRRVSQRTSKRLRWALVLGGLQGLMGWVMVQSGLVDMPRVSHYRLAAHLGLAFLLFAYLFWLILDLAASHLKENTANLKPLKNASLGVFCLICIQVIYGAFTAGLRAGIGYNTFPKMGDEWIPSGMFSMDPAWAAIFESNLTVQFIHRALAWILAIGIPVLYAYSRLFTLNRPQKFAFNFLLLSLFVQFLLGVFTLINYVPISLAVTHQAGAFVLFGAGLYVLHTLSPARRIMGLHL